MMPRTRWRGRGKSLPPAGFGAEPQVGLYPRKWAVGAQGPRGRAAGFSVGLGKRFIPVYAGGERRQNRQIAP